jgi:hypothetical protein
MVCCSRALPRSSLGGKKQEASFDNISWPAGVKFDPRGELCPLGGLFTPTVEDYRYEDGGGAIRRSSPLVDNFTPREQSSPLVAIFTPWAKICP